MNKLVWLVAVILVFTLSVMKESYGIEFTESGFIQTQFESHDNDNDTFKLLRARPKLKADLGEHVDFFVQLDVAYDRILRDVWVELDYHPYAKLRVGQFTLPFGWQTQVSPYNLLTINYSHVVEKLNGGDDLRDIGLLLHGNFADSNISVLESINYAVAVVNGEGTGSNIT
ncbi:MAG TPA: porin, partial [Anaerolineae bacterium]|nr:porin [Anaerolineae bacterium]